MPTGKIKKKIYFSFNENKDDNFNLTLRRIKMSL